jgi:hypothetical protein
LNLANNTERIGTAEPGFHPSCANPHFPGPAPATSLDIDVQCGNEGSGGKQFELNLAKNNFCASGPSSEISISDLEKLQQSVKQPSIKSVSLVSTTNRAPFQMLGEGKLVTLKAFVLIARQEPGESVNCGDNVSNRSLFHDIHITLVDFPNRLQPNDSKSVIASKECSGVVVEMSPHHRPDLWTADNLNKVAQAQAMVRVTGQQFFDSSHVPCLNGAAVGSNPKRISVWEIHPTYEFEVCTADCTRAEEWISLDQWVSQYQSNDPATSKNTHSREAQGVPQVATPQNFSPQTHAISPTEATEVTAPIRGNKRTKIYHWPGCPNYDDIAPRNRVPFGSREAAEQAGYRAARNCP